MTRIDLEIAPGGAEEVIRTIEDNTLEYHVVGIYTAGSAYQS